MPDRNAVDLAFADQRMRLAAVLAAAEAAPDVEADGHAGQHRAEVLAVLLASAFRHSYPSPGMLDRIEAELITIAEANVYLQHLVEWIAAERYPSPWMIDRLRAVSRSITAAEIVGSVLAD